ncbi:MAG TPA: peptidylprolyl isomerase, partial [Gaiellaceae bacterium]
MRRLPLLAVVCLLAACGGGKSASTTTTTQTQTQTTKDAAGCIPMKAPAAATRSEKKPTQMLDASKAYTVTLDTNCGSFTITLDQTQSPNAAASFVALTNEGFFNATIFHRIVPGFVIQGGDPTQTGTGGPGYTTIDKPPATAKYTLGIVAMAKTGAQPAGAAGSQFFVVTVADAGLPPDYAIVGKVTKGIGVVNRIGKLGDANEQPTEVVEIEKATVS